VGFLFEQGEESLLSEALENKKTQPKAVGLCADSRDRRNILRSEMNPGTEQSRIPLKTLMLIFQSQPKAVGLYADSRDQWNSCPEGK